MARLYRLSAAAAILTYALIVLGGITRVSGSGLGCEDNWPLCQGRPYPPLNLLAIIEYLHRTVAAAVGVVVLAVAAASWRSAGARRRTALLASAVFALIIAQALLGAFTVWFELPPEIVTAHLGVAMIFLASTMLTAYFIALDRGAPAWLVEAGRDPGLIPDRVFALVARAGAAVVFALILTGGATSTSGAALSCNQWPVCRSGALIPERTSRYTWINLTHRVTAVIAAVAVAFVLVQALRRPVSRAAKRLAIGAAALISAQILLGAAYVWTAGSPWLSAAHLAMATLLFATMVGLALIARQPAPRARHQVTPKLAAAPS